MALIGFSGVDLFTYTLRDGNGQTDVATVAIAVTALQSAGELAQVAAVEPVVQNTVYFTGQSFDPNPWNCRLLHRHTASQRCLLPALHTDYADGEHIAPAGHAQVR